MMDVTVVRYPHPENSAFDKVEIIRYPDGYSWEEVKKGTQRWRRLYDLGLTTFPEGATFKSERIYA